MIFPSWNFFAYFAKRGDKTNEKRKLESRASKVPVYEKRFPILKYLPSFDFLIEKKEKIYVHFLYMYLVVNTYRCKKKKREKPIVLTLGDERKIFVRISNEWTNERTNERVGFDLADLKFMEIEWSRIDASI